jgi:hypothetical protein
MGAPALRATEVQVNVFRIMTYAAVHETVEVESGTSEKTLK